MKARRIEITDTTLRDAHQSLWATRMRIGGIVPILRRMDGIGYHSVECWGGATFDSCLRFLDEDPWERLRTIKHHTRNTPLQMLLRGQKIVGYRHYGDEIVRAFVRQAADSGIDIFRVFDALNDTRNFKTAVDAIKESGKHFQGAVVYTISPVHTLDHYVEVAHELVEMGADSICIKDMAALLSPYFADRLVRRLKQEIDVPLQLHCHYIGGLAPMTYLKAIEAGVDIVDTATVPLAFGASQPATEMLVTALKGTPYDTELDLDLLFEVAEYFEGVREEVLEEIPRVRAEVGYPPLVTPLSQIVGTQAVLNVLTGKRWQVIPDEMKAYVRGRYGKAPGPIDPEIATRALGEEEAITGRPADYIDETLAQYEEQIGNLARSEEDIISYALFPNAARKYFERRHHGVEKDVFLEQDETEENATAVAAPPSGGATDRIRDIIAAVESANVDEVTIDDGGVKITVRKGGLKTTPYAEAPAPVQAQPAVESKASHPAPAEESSTEVGAGRGAEGGTTTAVPEGLFQVTAPMVGTFYAAPSPTSDPYVQVGQYVSEGDVLCILEAMKLMNELACEVSGTIRETLVENETSVEYGQPLFAIELDS